MSIVEASISVPAETDTEEQLRAQLKETSGEPEK